MPAMTDLTLAFAGVEIGTADLLMEAGGLATDDGLRSAIIVSLFTDARADVDDTMPAHGDRRGWWGDVAPAADRDVTGSKLWLLDREKIVAKALASARDYATAALAWLTEDRVAASVEIETAAIGATLALGVTVVRPAGPERRRFDFVWGSLA